MKRKSYLLAGLLIALLFLFASGTNSLYAADYPQCRNCHPQLDFAAGQVNRSVVCLNCHANGAHAPSVTYTVYGYFDTSNFTDPTIPQDQIINGLGASYLHGKHGGSSQTSSYCIGCHGRLTCKACHTSVGDPVIQKHEPHSTTVYPAPSLNMALGPGRGDRFPVIQLSCVSSQCHNLYPAVTKTRSDGSQLCLNCHATDGRGHYDRTQLDTKHSSAVPSTIKLGSIDYVVSCNSCHAQSLTGEHKNVAVKLNLPQDGECYYCHGQSAQATVVNAVYQIKTNNDSTTDLSVMADNRSCTVCHFNISVLPGNPAEHVTYHLSSLSNTFVDIAKNIHKDCNTCHDRATPLSVSVTVSGVVYQKNLTDMASMTPKNYSCLDCHNGNSNPKAPVHQAQYNGQAMGLLDVHADCSYCHTPGSEYAGKVDLIAADLKANPANSYSCTECHTNLNNSHNAYFQFGTETINLNTTKYHQSCAVCHGNAKVSGVITLLKGSTTAYNCNECHNGTAAKLALHTTSTSEAIIGYHPADANATRCDKCHGETNFAKIDIATWPVNYQCTNCHNGTIAETALHQAKDSSGSQYTTTSLHPTCGTCHDSADLNVQSVISTNRGTSTPYLCNDCHTGNLTPKHNANWINGTAYETTQFHNGCIQCHGNSNSAVTGKIHSLSTDLKAGTIAAYGCADCHGTIVPQAKHSAKMTAADLTEQETTQYHVKLAVNANDSCFSCHNNPVVQADLDYAIAQVKTGSGYLCTDCHKNTASAPYQPNHLAALGNEQLSTVNEHPACTTCHTTSADDKIRTLKGQTGYSCEACHTDLLANHKSTTNLADAAFVNCSWCHSSSDPVYSDNNLIGIHVKPNITLSKTYTCNVCHSATSPVKAQIAGKQTGCANCHNGTSAPVQHPDSQYYPKHVVNPFPTFMPEYSPNCATCHTDKSLISMHSVNYVGCNTCHTTAAYKPAVVSLNPDCSGCHNSLVNPAIDMAESHKPFHNANTAQYPATTTCLNCHAKDTTVNGQSLLAVHKKDINSTVTCDTCHGANARQAVKDAITAKNVSCQACHGEAGHNHPVTAAGYSADQPVDCGQCHSTNTADTGAELTTIHQQAADKGLIQSYSCATCHNSNIEGIDKVITRDGTLDMKKNGAAAIYCTDCHNGTLAEALGTKYPAHDGNHINSAAYGSYKGTYNGQAFDDSNVNCSKCHTSLETKTVHDPAVHTNVNCNSCHQSTNPEVKAVIAGAWSRAATKTSYTCASCHNTLPYKHQPEHLSTGNENLTCSTCHDGTNVKGAFSVPSGTTANVTAIHTTNGSADCNKCHTSSNLTVSQLIDTGVGKANSVYTCAACHDTITPKHVKQHTITNYLSSGNANCSGCHNADVSVLHSSVTKATLNCDTCHGANPALPNTKATILANLSNKTSTPSFTCESCHQNAAGGHNHRVPMNGYSETPNVDCGKCHSTNADGSAELYAVHQNAADAGKISGFSCSTCHNATFEGTGKPIVKDGVLDMKQNGTTQLYCTDCHNGILADALGTKYPAHEGNHINSIDYGSYKGTYNGLAFDDSSADCSKCHTSLDTKVVHDPVVHQNLSCNTCHQSTNNAVQAVIAGAWSRAAAKTDYTCSSCHSTLPYKHRPEHTATSADYTALDCSGCHSSTTWSNGNAKLSDLHNNNCNTCHASTNSVVNSFIAGKQGQINPTYNCEGCHTTGGAQAKETVHQPEHLAKHSANGMNCSSCHSFNLQAETVGDISAIHTNGCATCHSATAPDNVKVAIALKKGQNNAVYSCEDCHGSIHLGWDAKHKPVFPTVDNLDCVDCHDNNLPNEHQKVLTPITNTAIAYQVFRSTASTGPWTLAGSTTATGYADTGLAANTTYYYKIKAYDGKPNYSGDSTVISSQTQSSSAVLTTVNPDAANYASGNNGDSSADPASTTNVLTDLIDTSNSSYITTSENGSSDKYVIVKLNQDAGNYSKVELKMTVRYNNSTKLKIYPYAADTTINTASPVYGLYRSSSSSYITETIDVTAAAKTMSGKGWMKFRIKPDPNKDATIYIAKVQINLTQNPVSSGTATNPPGTLTANTNDTIAPTVPNGLSASSNYYDRVDLTWTASTDTSGVSGDVCAVCHTATAGQQVKDAITNRNANCSACHIIHTEANITAAHTGNALPTTPWACAKCHSNVLSLEHSANAALKQNGLSGLGCATCHESTSTKVQAAIHSTVTDKSNLACGACHTGTADGVPAVHIDIASPHLTGIFPTASDTDCLNCHTTQAAEFTSDKGGYHVVNNLVSKASGYGLYLTPFNSKSVVGCQGCHGNFNDGKAQASHILKRPYTYTSNSGQIDMLCYLCHNRSAYGGGSSSSSGFSGLHNIGDHEINNVVQCSWCHAAVPHATSKAHLIVTTNDPNSAGSMLSNFYHPASGQYQVSSCGSNVNACDEHKGY